MPSVEALSDSAEAELRRLNDMLEQRIAAQTAELALARNQLTTELGERARADARLNALQSELFHAARLGMPGQWQPRSAIRSISRSRPWAIRSMPRWACWPTVESRSSARRAKSWMKQRSRQIIRRLRDLIARGETETWLESSRTMVEEASALAVSGSGSLSPKVLFRFGIDATTVVANRIVEIVVADNGPGVAQEIRLRLFEPFVSARGMGLGLSICRSIIEAHGPGNRARDRRSRQANNQTKADMPPMSDLETARRVAFLLSKPFHPKGTM
jgi:phosphoglycerate-specific signal transduction histidine kinase